MAAKKFKHTTVTAVVIANMVGTGVFINNGEDFISKTSPFKSITVSYERASYPFLAWHTDPIILYFILTLVLGLVFKPMIRVSI